MALLFLSVCSFQGTMPYMLSYQGIRLNSSLSYNFLSLCPLAMGSSGLEPPTSRLSGVRSNRLSYKPIFVAHSFECLTNGDGEIRTLDPLLARQVLSQLSYTPIIWQPPTLPRRLQRSTIGRLRLNHRVRDGNGCVP